MKLSLLQAAKKWLAAPVVLLASAIATGPSQAATFAQSEGAFTFTGFSQSPTNTQTSAIADTLAISEGGLVVADSRTEAVFLSAPSPTATNFFFNQTSGQKSNYLGLAQSQTSLIGTFQISAGDTFSFDFLGSLALTSEIDNPRREQANTTASLSFVVLSGLLSDRPIALDFFEVFGRTHTPGSDDFLTIQGSDAITLNPGFPVVSLDLDGPSEVVFAEVSGSFRRTFEQDTLLTLVEVTQGTARVQEVPESLGWIALIAVLSGSIGIRPPHRSLSQKEGSAN